MFEDRANVHFCPISKRITYVRMLNVFLYFSLSYWMFSSLEEINFLFRIDFIIGWVSKKFISSFPVLGFCNPLSTNQKLDFLEESQIVSQHFYWYIFWKMSTKYDLWNMQWNIHWMRSAWERRTKKKWPEKQLYNTAHRDKILIYQINYLK